MMARNGINGDRGSRVEYTITEPLQGKKGDMLGYGFHLIPDTRIEVTTDYDYLHMEDLKDSEKGIYCTAQAVPMSLRTRSCMSEAEHQMGQENKTGDWMSHIQMLGFLLFG